MTVGALRPTVLGGVIAGAALVLTACSLAGKPPGHGDPGNRRLHQLAADPIFGAVPPGAEAGELRLVRASYRSSVFEASGWNGPSVIRTFESSAAPISVYEFYGQRARDVGWTAALAGSLHVTDRWRKTYRNGATGYLSLFISREPATGPREYQLSGGISQPR